MASLLLEDIKEIIGIFVLDTTIAVCLQEHDAHRVIK